MNTNIHNGLTIEAEVNACDIKKLRDHLVKWNKSDFDNCKTIFFSSAVILPKQHYGNKELPETLMFFTSYSGPLKEHINELLAHHFAFLNTMLLYCKGYQGGSHDVLRKFIKCHKRSNIFFSAYHGLSPSDVRAQDELKLKIENYKDANYDRFVNSGMTEEQVEKELSKKYRLELDRVKTTPFEKPTLNPYIAKVLAPFILWALVAQYFCKFFSLFLIPFLILIVIAAVFAFVIIKVAEAQPDKTAIRPDDSHVRKVLSTQTSPGVNEMTAAGPLKKSIARRLLYFLIIKVVGFVQNWLGAIPNVSTARWTSANGGRRLVFISNFTGTTEFYIRDFIDAKETAKNINLLFGHGSGFPKTKCLRKDGCVHNPQAFMDVVVSNQHIASFWYNRFPKLTHELILKNRDSIFKLSSIEETNDQTVSLDKKDIQALLVRGHDELKVASYLLLQIKDPKLAKQFLHDIADDITPAERANVKASQKEGNDTITALQIAFSRSGFEKLNLPGVTLKSFSREFNEGMDEPYRSKYILGDTHKNVPGKWNWGRTNRDDPTCVDIILFCYAKDKPLLKQLKTGLKTKIYSFGLTIILEDQLDTTASPNQREHFGFRDGISQPIMEGLSKSDKSLNPTKAGEFILGYKNEYDRYTDSPIIPARYDPDGLLDPLENAPFKNFGKNGTYVVFRQYKQHVYEFWNHLKTLEPGKEIELATKMIGRWPNGAPLVKHSCEPDVDPNKPGDNDFTFGNPNNTAACPYGAHIRRCNPRDDKVSQQDEAGSLDIIRKRKLLRRGRIYGPPIVESMDPMDILNLQHNNANDRGLFFISLQTNINRQFEFIQSVWVSNPGFNGQTNETDPILSPGLSDFSCPAQPLPKKYKDLPAFTQLLGGGYFFMPGINALKLLAEADFDPHLPAPAPTGPSEAKYTDKIIALLKASLERDYAGQQKLRRFHAKTIGICKAYVHINHDLPAELKVGLFSKKEPYEAIIRYTNANTNSSSDAKKGTRGMAIKILDVGNEVIDTDLLNGKPTNVQDLLLTTNKTLSPHSPAGQWHAMLLVFGKGTKRLKAFLGMLNIISGGLFIVRGNKQVTNVLHHEYYSGSPVRFGADCAIKWAAIPQKKECEEMPASPNENFLGERLHRDLKVSSKWFDLMVQFSEDVKTEPIENTSVAWKTAFVKVGCIEILQQDISDSENEFPDKDLSFSPWHCLRDHEPLGAINRIRRKIYAELSKFKPLLLILFSTLSFLQPQAQIIDASVCDSTNRFAITQLSNILTTNSLISIDSAVQLDRQHAFKQSPDLPVNVVDYDPYYYWFRFIIKNDKTVDRELMLVMAPIGLREGWLYQYQQDKWQETVHTGLRIPFVKRPYYFSHNVFPIKIRASGTDTIYLRTDASNVYKSFGFALIKPKPLRIFENKLYFFFGIMVGLLLLFFIFNIYLFFSLKEKIHLWYSLYIVLLFLIVMKNDHLDQQFLGWDSEFAYQLTPYMAIGAVALSVLMHVVDLFLHKQLRSHKKFHSWYKIIKINTLLSGFGHFIFFYTGSNYKLLSLAFNWAKYSTQLAMIMIIIACILAIKKGFKSGYFILSGLLLFLIGASQRLFFPSTTSFLFPPTTFHIGIIMETFIISFGLIFQYRIDRVKRRRLEKNYQQELHNAQIEAQEQTMKNISQEIHDNIGQTLTLVKLNLASIQDHYNQTIDTKLSQARSELSKAISELRHLSKSLNSERLAQVGLVEAIRSELDLVSKSTNITTSFENKMNGLALDPKVEFMLFRMMQEAIQNTIKHANASQIKVEIQSNPKKFILYIQDNGKGFNVSDKNTYGNGLTNLKNRCKLINANFNLTSGLEVGTKLQVELQY